MLRISIPEYGRIPREAVDDRLLRRLQRFDESHDRRTGETIFDWNRVHYVRALNYVGVIQVPGITIEVLPKIDTSCNINVGPYKKDSQNKQLAQQNLLYMLSISRNLPLRERDVARQRIQKLPLLEFLILLFARRLLRELRRGVERDYVYREENLPYIKGKLLLSKQIQANVGRSDRMFVGYDEFKEDIWLNRILKVTCHTLLTLTSSSRVSQHLREALLELADVKDHIICNHHFARVHLDRSSERFRPLLDFCRVVLSNYTPAPSFGQAATFSLVFPMERLFEEFIGQFLKKYASDIGLQSKAIHLQASRRRRWLMRTPQGTGRFRLKPDVVIDGDSEGPAIILDTKWKRLLSDAEDSRNGVSQADIYQLYAYANRYKCGDNVLLFPRVEGVTPKAYTIEADVAEKRWIRVAFVDLSRDLVHDKEGLKADIQLALSCQHITMQCGMD